MEVVFSFFYRDGPEEDATWYEEPILYRNFEDAVKRAGSEFKQWSHNRWDSDCGNFRIISRPVQ